MIETDSTRCTSPRSRSRLYGNVTPVCINRVTAELSRSSAAAGFHAGDEGSHECAQVDSSTFAKSETVIVLSCVRTLEDSKTAAWSFGEPWDWRTEPETTEYGISKPALFSAKTARTRRRGATSFRESGLRTWTENVMRFWEQEEMHEQSNIVTSTGKISRPMSWSHAPERDEELEIGSVAAPDCVFLIPKMVMVVAAALSGTLECSEK
mmetsp:Transcript_57658/g.137202  ORF Transcript_57658/g.137202 Transcript_57658/m.137202 type:complete len:209 (+) Transcript_57658:431-1057(+)